MKIKLNSTDVMEIARATKSGWLDVARITRFKFLLDSFNPPKRITREQLQYYLDCLYMGWGYIPTDEGEIAAMMLDQLPTELKDKWRKSIEDGSIYKRLVRDIFLGMVAMRALGGKFHEKEPDYSFCEKDTKFRV